MTVARCRKRVHPDTRRQLAQLDALALGQSDQLLDCAVGEPGVGRMRGRLLVHRRVHTLGGHQILISGDVVAYYSCRFCHPSLDRRRSNDLICAEMSLIEPGERDDQ